MKLYYFDVSGKAESTRIVLNMGGIPFEDIRITHQDFFEMKSKFPNQQVPVLELDSGEIYCQSNAIFRYASKLAGLYPKDEKEALSVDMLIDQIDECFGAIVQTFKLDEHEKLIEREKLFSEDGKVYNRIKTINEWIKGPYFLGEELSCADIQIFCFVNFIESGFLDGVDRVYFNVFKRIRDLHYLMSNNDKIVNYYSIV